MTYRDRLIEQLENDVEYFKRSYEFKARMLRETRKAQDTRFLDRLATAALIAACGLAIYLTLAALADFGYWMENGWR